MTDLGRCFRIMHLFQFSLLSSMGQNVSSTHSLSSFFPSFFFFFICFVFICFSFLSRLPLSLPLKVLALYEHRLTYNGSYYSLLVKIPVALIFLGLYIYLVLNIIKFGNTQSDHLQIALCQSFFLWLFMEIFFIETFIVYFIHVLIPSTISSELKTAKAYMMKLINSIDFDVRNESNKPSTSVDDQFEFNLAKFLSVPYRMSETFPELTFEKKVVQVWLYLYHFTILFISYTFFPSLSLYIYICVWIVN